MHSVRRWRRRGAGRITARRDSRWSDALRRRPFKNGFHPKSRSSHDEVKPGLQADEPKAKELSRMRTGATRSPAPGAGCCGRVVGPIDADIGRPAVVGLNREGRVFPSNLDLTCAAFTGIRSNLSPDPVNPAVPSMAGAVEMQGDGNRAKQDDRMLHAVGSPMTRKMTCAGHRTNFLWMTALMTWSLMTTIS